MKVFIDYDHDNDCYVASSEDATIVAQGDNEMKVKLAFIFKAKSLGHSGQSADYDFTLRSSKLAQEGDKPVDLDEFWGNVNQTRIERRKKILELADQGVDFTTIANKLDIPVGYVHQVVNNDSSS